MLNRHVVSIAGIMRNNLISRPWLRVRFSEVPTVRLYAPDDICANNLKENEQLAVRPVIPPPFEVTTTNFDEAFRRHSVAASQFLPQDATNSNPTAQLCDPPLENGT